MIKKYEFWHPRLFEAPYYAYIGFLCLINGISIRTLAKANYGLNHGEIGIGSKYETQMAFDQTRFLPTLLLDDDLVLDAKQQKINEFADQHGFPLILKSDVGCVGKGVVKLKSPSDIADKTPLLLGKFILQKFTPFEHECGIFYTRLNGQPKITGINIKHFPSVVGNGVDSIDTLARSHERYSAHWNAFLQEHDLSEVLDAGVEKRVSFIGSHTLGCKFTDDTHLLTKELEQQIFSLFDSQPGFNFGRVDIKFESLEALQKGEFVVIEVNGVASLPTHMFDPKYTVWQAYKIFLSHAKLLVKIAKQNRRQSMELMSYGDAIKQIKANQSMLNEVHQKLMGNTE